ncbi:hypothetical protein FOA52_005065 [Chlamydomonas sp. UWO 241]|nr:hypothetical protein FOA52_005065 [Chlamydomonas sp. UWO 241]
MAQQAGGGQHPQQQQQFSMWGAAGVAARGGGGEQHAPPPSCPPGVSPPMLNEMIFSVFPERDGGARVLHDVCLEGDTIVLHGSNTAAGSWDFLNGGGLPMFDVGRFEEFYRHARPPGSSVDGGLLPVHGTQCRHAPLRFRYPSQQEAAQQPYFSDCTVPLLVFSNWIFNFAEFLTRVPARLVRFQRVWQVFDGNITVVLATCGALPLAPYHRQLVAPFTRHEVTNWASFAAPGASSQSKATAESVNVRCFKRLAIVGFTDADYGQSYTAAQAALSYHQRQLPPSTLFKSGATTLKLLFEARMPAGHLPSSSTGATQDQAAGEPPPSQEENSTAPLAADLPEMVSLRAWMQRERLQSAEFPREPASFASRPVYRGTRQLLGLEQLLADCRSHDWSGALADTLWTGVECAAYSFGEEGKLLQDMAAAQQANVFLSLHGAGEMNSLFMRHGSIKVQLRPKDFGTVHRWMSNGYWPKVCQQAGHPVQCWFVNIEEEGSWEPGVVERLGLYWQSDNERCRDRHFRLTVRHVDAVLRRALPLHGKREAFVARWEAGPMAITFNDGGNITWAPHMEV